MRPLQISPETAQKLAKELKVPLEHLMHMPQHILLQKLAEMSAKQTAETTETAPGQAGDTETDKPGQE
ncbi:YycC family protein [Paenibacillus cremeus]|uniref:YycC family protein n=1 Tax=Paenibacillus cremeus TaxID=2163881 RepID=A0A559KBC1_9BACL|nr:YycC family protein [Paenibacillus cremeus]TVY09426.1 YycC family protein [Paenibacillus cremeus]